MRFITVHEGQDTLARVCAVKCDVPAFPEPNSSIGIWDSEEKQTCWWGNLRQLHDARNLGVYLVGEQTGFDEADITGAF